MKSEILKSKIKQELPFPKLMQGTNSGIVVFFSQEKKGQVLNGSNSAKSIGDYHEEFNMEFFTDFDGTIKLSNK
jgi:hypothetical protein